MNYTLHNTKTDQQNTSLRATLQRLFPLMKGEGRHIAWASVAIMLNAVATLIAPVLMSKAIDTAIVARDLHAVFVYAVGMLGLYLIALVGGYIQTMVMGGVGRRVLFNLRTAIFHTLQELPVAFFHQNKTGDLISRINSDTDKLNQFFSQALMQFMRNFFLIFGAAIFLVSLNARLGVASLVPAFCIVLVTRLISGWIKRKNMESLQSSGNMSAEIQESLSNFKVIVAFNRLDYFRKKFDEVNQRNFLASVQAGYANTMFTPMYGLASNVAQLIVVAYGIHLISSGQMTVGLLIGFLLYVVNFYSPLQQLASVWSSFQQALAALDRISEVLAMDSDLQRVAGERRDSVSVMEFTNVHFRYPDGAEVLGGVSFHLEPGKTYALVGPTGGGKTTTASLMARLYDPTEGTVMLHGKDIRSYAPEERTRMIGFILQEPFLFSGTLLENIFYGNTEFAGRSADVLMQALSESGLDKLLTSFTQGLETSIQTSGDTISLGQKQLIAFVRAVLRKPDMLILDEATANIDTVTEQLLEQALLALPASTTKVIIAHRLHTIENADEIFFVNAGTVTPAGSFEHAVEMLMHGKRQS